MSIGAVVVTYNRLNELKKALRAYEEQTKLPKYIVVVNNCSTDGTAEYLGKWKKMTCNFSKYVITMNTNTGGAGGFYTGLNYAMGLDAEWVWVADDDAFPCEDAFERLLDGYKQFIEPKGEKVSAICAAVINNGKIHVQHRNRLKTTALKIKIVNSVPEDYQNHFFGMDIFSYVGSAISKDALLKVGSTNKNYFIYCDDQEHSLRLRKYGKMYCIPSSKVIHNTPGFNTKAFFWGHYYFYRNSLLMIRANYPTRFLLKWLKGFISRVLLNKKLSDNEKNVIKSAYLDALRGKEGLHSIYRPGWKPGGVLNLTNTYCYTIVWNAALPLGGVA